MIKKAKRTLRNPVLASLCGEISFGLNRGRRCPLLLFRVRTFREEAPWTDQKIKPCKTQVLKVITVKGNDRKIDNKCRRILVQGLRRDF